MILSILTNIIVYLLNFRYGIQSTCSADTQAQVSSSALTFELRHQHAVSSTARVVFADVPATHIYSHKDNRSPYSVQTRPITTHRPPSFGAFSDARMRSIRHGQNLDMRWQEVEIIGPNVESRETLLELAKMTNNAYVEPEDPAWYDLGGKWTEVR
jgi:lipase ATG15